MTDHELLERSLAELQSQVERHKRFVRGFLEGRPADAGDCPWSDCHHRHELLDLVLKAVAILDETRKAFKSKQLETLRKDFTRVIERELQTGRPAAIELRE